MRDTAKRPEWIAAGTLKLVGTSDDVICQNFFELLTNQEAYDKMSKTSNPYGDGYTSDCLCHTHLCLQTAQIAEI